MVFITIQSNDETCHENVFLWRKLAFGNIYMLTVGHLASSGWMRNRRVNTDACRP